mgnify:CR=1 FL=1
MENVTGTDNTQWEQRTSSRLRLSELEEGDELVGHFCFNKEIPIKDRETGHLKEVMSYTLAQVSDQKDKFSFIGDAGFNMEFNNANIKENDLIKIVKGDKVSLGGGKKVNTYQIFVAKVNTKM